MDRDLAVIFAEERDVVSRRTVSALRRLRKPKPRKQRRRQGLRSESNRIWWFKRGIKSVDKTPQHQEMLLHLCKEKSESTRGA